MRLDPERTALVLIDLMPRIIGMETAPYSGDAVLANCLRLADAFQAVYAPVVSVRVERPNTRQQPEGSELVPAILERSDVEVVKRSWGAFYKTNLHAVLQARGIRTIVFGGIATNMGVESTVRAAADYGYKLVLVEDAMTGADAAAHKFAIDYVFPKLGTVTSTDKVLAELGSPPPG